MGQDLLGQALANMKQCFSTHPTAMPRGMNRSAKLLIKKYSGICAYIAAHRPLVGGEPWDDTRELPPDFLDTDLSNRRHS